jgi:cation transport regulator ChaC
VRTALFAYGSLVSPRSAERTLARPVADAIPARLIGWRRRWSQARDNLTSEKTFARVADGSIPPYVLGLNVEPGGGAEGGPNGVLFEVSEPEIARLDVREIRYDRVVVSAQIDRDAGSPEFDRVITYVGKPANFAPDPPPGAVVLASYVEAVESAFAALGEAQLRLYLDTTEAPPVEVVEASLVRDHIPPGNPRDW